MINHQSLDILKIFIVYVKKSISEPAISFPEKFCPKPITWAEQSRRPRYYVCRGEWPGPRAQVGEDGSVRTVRSGVSALTG